MIKFFLLLSFVCGNVFASSRQVIDTLGTSPKGQYVALEEYGYHRYKNAYYVNIKIINVWTKEYVGSTFQVELPAHGPEILERAREEARSRASNELKRFQISG